MPIGLRSVLGLVLALAVILAMLLPANSRAQEAMDGQGAIPSDPLAGRIIFSEKGCIKCHSVWSQGGTLGPDLARSKTGLSVLQLAGVLWNHSPAMIEKMRERRIVRPTLNTQEMSNLAAFLYFLDYFDVPGNADRGQALFAEKGCVKCHAVGGVGGHVGPALDKYKKYASPLFLTRAMWRHGAAMSEKMAAQNVTRPRFEGHDLADIFAFIQRASSDSGGEKIYMEPGSPARGEKVFAEKGCIRCHAVRDRGGHIGPDLGKVDSIRLLPRSPDGCGITRPKCGQKCMR